MKLETLTIENFRGVRGTYEFTPHGRNAVIVGPNGSGKSSLIEAIDFLLTDRITHLSGEGTGVIDQSAVIPNVDVDGECSVTGAFSADALEGQPRITRDAETRQLDPPVDGLPAALQQTIETARQGQHILTRSDLLDLVLAQPTSRRDALVELLDLPNIDDRRLVLKRTRETIAEERDEAEASRTSVGDRLRDLTDSAAADRDALRTDVLAAINDLRAQFDAEPLASIEVADVRSDIKSPAAKVSTEALQREQPREELAQLSTWLDDLQAELPDRLRKLHTNLSAFHARETPTVTARRLEFLDLAEEVIPPDAEQCPLCRQQWTKATPLHEEVRNRREQLHDLQELKQRITDTKAEIRSRLRTGLDHLEYLTKELDAETYPEVATLNGFIEDLEDCSEQLAGDVFDATQLVRELPIESELDEAPTLALGEPVEAIQALQRTADDVPDLSATEERYERIQTVADQWAEYERLGERAAELERLRAAAETAEQEFIHARKDVIGDIYDDIAARVQTFYSTIHPDESDASTSIEITDTGAELQKEFYDTGEYPPQAVHSEGHLDTLGLCLHLALADYLQQDNESLLLLDDVVMSVDHDHRLAIARMLADEFAEQYQLVITTHDELWAEQLTSQGALRGGHQLWLREWSLDGGVTESRQGIDVTDQWETVREAMDADEMERAAHELRYATERMLQQACLSLDAKVEYDPRQRHTLSDFKDAVCRRLDTLTGRAKDNLDLHDEEEEEVWERADELDDAYGRILDDVGQHLQHVNRRVHWTPGKWLTLRPHEFQEVFEAHREAYELLYCQECGSSIRYEQFDEEYHELRCNCRAHYDITWS